MTAIVRGGTKAKSLSPDIPKKSAVSHKPIKQVIRTGDNELTEHLVITDPEQHSNIHSYLARNAKQEHWFLISCVTILA